MCYMCLLLFSLGTYFPLTRSLRKGGSFYTLFTLPMLLDGVVSTVFNVFRLTYPAWYTRTQITQYSDYQM